MAAEQVEVVWNNRVAQKARTKHLNSNKNNIQQKM